MHMLIIFCTALRKCVKYTKLYTNRTSAGHSLPHPKMQSSQLKQVFPRQLALVFKDHALLVQAEFKTTQLPAHKSSHSEHSRVWKRRQVILSVGQDGFMFSCPSVQKDIIPMHKQYNTLSLSALSNLPKGQVELKVGQVKDWLTEQVHLSLFSFFPVLYWVS